MKTKDIMTALGDVDNRYKRESAEENAKVYFKKGNGARILKYVLSGAALLGLAAFAVFAISTKYSSDNIAMVEPGAKVGFSTSKTTITETAVNGSGADREIEIARCTLKGGDPQTVSMNDPDYIMTGGTYIYKIDYDYAFGTGDEEGYFTKSKDGAVLWTYKWKDDTDPDSDHPRFEHFTVLDCGVLLVRELGFGHLDPAYKLKLALLDDTGNEVWVQKYTHNMGAVAGIYYDEDTIYVVSYTDTEQWATVEGRESVVHEQLQSFVISEFSKATGDLIRNRQTPVQIDISSSTVRCLGKVDTGYVIMYYDLDYRSNLVLLSYDRGVERMISFGVNYEFGTAQSLNGKIYLSGKLMSPGQNMGADAYFYVPGHNGPAALWRYRIDLKYANKEYKDVAEEYKEGTSAVLLVCDGSLSPEQIYVQEGAYGGALEKTENGLTWDVAQISTVYAGAEKAGVPFVFGSSRTYTLGEKGLIASCEDTAKSYVMIGIYYPYE